MPAPNLVNPYEPEMAPDNVKASELVTLMKLSAFKVMLPSKELVESLRVPPFKVIALAPTATLRRSKVAPLATVTIPPLLFPRPLSVVMAKVPALMLVSPE